MIRLIVSFLLSSMVLFATQVSSLDFDLVQSKDSDNSKTYTLVNDSDYDKIYKLYINNIDEVGKFIKVSPSNIYLEKGKTKEFTIKILKNDLPPKSYSYYLVIAEKNKNKISINTRLNIKQKFYVK